MSERRIWFWVAGLVLVLVALYFLRGILLPFVAGMAIAYLLDPICDRLDRWGCPRSIAAVLVLVVFVLAVVAVLLLLVPLIQAQLSELIVRLPDVINALGTRMQSLLSKLARRIPLGEMSQLGTMLRGQSGNVLNWAAQVVGSVLSGGWAVVNILSLIFITPVVAFYLLRDWDRLVARVNEWLPRDHAGVIRDQARQMDATLAGYVRGQALVCLFLGTFYAVGLSSVGLDSGLSIGLLAGVLSFIPYVGTLVGFVCSVGLAFAQFSEWPPIIVVIAIFVAGQILEGYVLSPKLVGERVGLHPVWVIFALLAGGALFGFVGILLALPVAAMAGVLTRFALRRYLASPYYRGDRVPLIIATDGDAPNRALD